MNNDEIVDDLLLCDVCESDFQSEDDLFPYEELYVCTKCYDKLRLADEQEVQEWETEGYEYEYE